jgi:preprotein translocase subunit SecA
MLMNYIFLAAQMLQGASDREITEQILEHLEDARDQLEVVWGKMEFERFRLADLPLSQLDPQAKASLSEELGAEKLAEIENHKVDDLSEDEMEALAAVLGRRVQNGIYRHILVSVISELWVEYLTKVDALRVSIGLEAFAQRDPLVQYKSKAAEYFTELLSDIRIGVINRMFRFQPRRAGNQATADQRQAAAQASASTPAQPQVQSGDSKKKRKRH